MNRSSKLFINPSWALGLNMNPGKKMRSPFSRGRRIETRFDGDAYGSPNKKPSILEGFVPAISCEIGDCVLLGLPHDSSCGKHVFFVGCFSSCPHCLSLLNDGHVAKADTLAAGWARKSLSQTWSSGVVQDGDLNTMPSPTLPQPSGSISLVYYCFTNIWVGFIGKSISIGRQRGLFQCQNERFESVGYIHLEIKDIKGTPAIHIQKVRRTVHSWQKFPQNTPRERKNNRLFWR